MARVFSFFCFYPIMMKILEYDSLIEFFFILLLFFFFFNRGIFEYIYIWFEYLDVYFSIFYYASIHLLPFRFNL